MTMYEVSAAPKTSTFESNGKTYRCDAQTLELLRYESRRGERYAGHVFAVMLASGKIEEVKQP